MERNERLFQERHVLVFDWTGKAVDDRAEDLEQLRDAVIVGRFVNVLSQDEILQLGV